MTLLESWGYLSMIIVLISMLMTDIRKLRIINSIACSMFIIYGYFHEAYPVVLMNTIVIIINLIKLKQNK
jgi:hypothetical protein